MNTEAPTDRHPLSTYELFEALPDGALLLDSGGIIRHTNERVLTLLQYGRSELEGQPVTAVLPSFGVPGVDPALIEPIEGTASHSREYSALRRDGEHVQVDVAISRLPSRMPDEHTLVELRDISEQKRGEIALRESEERYRLLVQLSPEPIIVHRRGIMFFANNAAAALFNLPKPGDMIGRSILEFVPDEYLGLVRKRLTISDEEIQAGGPLHMQARRQDGTLVYLEVMAARFSYEGERASQVILRDVTVQKKAEEELLRLNRALKAMSAVNQMLIRSRDEQEFLHGVCRIICEVGGYRMVWVGFADPEPGHAVRPVAWAGHEEGYLSSILVTWDESISGLGPIGKSIRLGTKQVMRDIRTELLHERWRAEALKRGYASILGLPLVSAGKVFGSLGIYASDADAFDDAEATLLTQLANDLAFGIIALRAQCERDQAERELRSSREQLRDLSSYLLKAREEEREAIAREIHDEFGQTLTALKMDTVWIEEELFAANAGTSPQLTSKIKGMQEIIDRTIKTIRRIATDLRPVLLESLGLIAAIEWLTDDFSSRTGIPCELISASDDLPLDHDRAIAVFRICQEALTNVVRHANASRVSVTLDVRDEVLVLTVSDNGKGIDDTRPRGANSFGLVGMRERARLVGGTLSVTRRPEGGTLVSVSIPLSGDRS
jgi:PAS domain S-box-containing protein